VWYVTETLWVEDAQQLLKTRLPMSFLSKEDAEEYISNRKMLPGNANVDLEALEETAVPPGFSDEGFIRD
jgi:hypothetical protein